MTAVLEKPAVKKELEPFEPALLGRDPFRLFDWLKQEMDRTFESMPFNRLTPTPRFEPMWMPALEVYDKNGDLHIKADLPGLTKEDVTVEVTADGITIKGERKSELTEEKKEEGYFRTERTYGEFCRFVPLPENTNLENVEAMFKDGVLEVIVPIPKAEKIVPKKIAIK